MNPKVENPQLSDAKFKLLSVLLRSEKEKNTEIVYFYHDQCPNHCMSTDSVKWNPTRATKGMGSSTTTRSKGVVQEKKIKTRK